MAISKRYKEKLENLLLTSNVFSKQKLVEALGVAPNWISRNINELESLGIVLEKQSYLENKKDKLISNLLDLKSFNHLLLKHYINKSYVDVGLVAPFLIETKEIQDSIKANSIIDSLDIQIIEKSFDYLSLLKRIIECEDYLDPFHSNNFPVNIIIYLKTLYDSLDLLSPISISEEMRLIIINTFKDLFNLSPTEEQLQVVAKSINYASSDILNYKSASIQSDAGSSKSTSALVIQNILRCNLNPLIVAKTNKAISGMPNAKTISKFLQENVGLSTTKDTWEEKRLKAFQKKDTIPFLIVDESSQVGELERIILSTVCKKILFIGDQNQCKPIHDRQAVNVVYLHSLKTQYRFLNSEMVIDDTCFQVLFSKLHKQKRRENLINLFSTVISGTFNTEGYYEKEENTFVLKNNYSNSFINYVELFSQYSDNDSIIIAYSQNAVDTINGILNNGFKFRLNSKVSLRLNDYSNNQFNGFQYRIIKVEESNKFLCKSIETGEEYLFPGSWLTLSYAITTMSAQGSQWKHVLGIDKTSPSLELWTDRYVIVTRGSCSVKFISSEGMDKSKYVQSPLISSKDILERFESVAKEGNRNNTLYTCVQELNKINATKDDYNRLYLLATQTGLPIKEIDSVFNSRKDSFSLDLFKTNTNIRTQKYFTPVFKNGSTLSGENRKLSFEDANSYPNTIYVAEELKNSNRIVIDCDSKDTVKLFEQYINLTEAYINQDHSSAHFVFITDKIVPTRHKKGIDLLGNEKYSLRNIKNNKEYNNLLPIVLTQEILDIFNEL